MDQTQQKQTQPRTDYTWTEADKKQFLEALNKLDKSPKK